jgi:hypothetical protein
MGVHDLTRMATVARIEIAAAQSMSKFRITAAMSRDTAQVGGYRDSQPQ